MAESVVDDPRPAVVVRPQQRMPRAVLAEGATRTNPITLGTGVLNVWGRTPASIAMLATSHAEASGDRFVLGLGAGSHRSPKGCTTSSSPSRSSGSPR
ncbi:MAG TPA: LLM class flavin-dependent oxidoreductase [Ornithinibacter sp.]|nr:LLM class flavin-dependent oxidoreductase [Ornithinibacter sp.]